MGMAMGFLDALLPKPQRRSGDAVYMQMLRGKATSVTPSNALQIAAVFSCVRVLSESIAMLPLELRVRLARGSDKAVNHPLYLLLHDLPNPEMTSIELRMTLMGHVAGWGNAYGQIIRDRAGRVLELWPLRPEPERMKPYRSDQGELLYEYTEADGSKRIFHAWEILHIKGLSSDGLTGYSPIAQARRTFEIKASMEQYQDSFYENNATPGVVLKHPGKLSLNAQKNILGSWNERHRGAARANSADILEEGMSIEQIGIPQADSQFLESQKYTRNEIAALFKVPSHMINDLDRATFGNIEQMSLEFVIYTLTPWLVEWEQAISRDLLSTEERGRFYAKHSLQALLRGDNASRAQFYSTGLQWGYLSINDVRVLEDQNPIANGDTYFVPLNMVPIDVAVKGQAPAAPALASVRALIDHDHPEGCTCGAHRGAGPSAQRADDDGEDLRKSRVELARSMSPVLEDIATRTVKREARDIRKAVEKHLRKRADDDFSKWLTEFYADFNNVVEDAFRAALMTMARQAMMSSAAELGEKSKGLTDQLRAFVNDYLAAMGNGWAGSSRTQIEIVLADALAAGVDPADAIEERLTRWEETKPTKVADRHSIEGLNAFVLKSYAAYSITRFQWLAAGESCPFCRQLSGKTAGIEESIVEAGATLDGGDAGGMQISRNVRHGPLHGGCDCMVRAVRD